MPSECGLVPIEYNVIVRPDPVETVSKGGIILPNNERDEWEVQEGEIVAQSVLAYTYAEWPENAMKPIVGDRVMFAKFAGSLIERGGVKYRVMNDKSIIGIVEPSAQAVAAAA